MKRIVIAFVCLGVIAVAFVSVYFMFLSPKPTLEIVKVERFDNFFVTTVRNNMQKPSDGYIPDSMRIRIGTVIVYNTQNQVVNTWSSYSHSLEPEQTSQIRTDFHLNDGYSVVIKGLRADSGEEIFSNKYYL